MGQLNNQYVSQSYQGLLKMTNSTTGVTGTLQTVQTGDGTDTPLQISKTEVNISGSLTVNGAPISFDTGSFATTGSNTFVGKQTITGSNGNLVYDGSMNADTSLASIHANDATPWLERFYNDTFSDTNSVMSYFGWDDGRFIFHNDSTQSISISVNGYASDNLVVGDTNTTSNNDLIVSGSLHSTDIIGTGSLFLQPNQGDARYLEVYNTSPTDTHITASGGQLFIGDDVTYVKVETYGSVNHIDIVADNGVNVSGSLQLTGSLNQTGTFYPDQVNWYSSSIAQGTGSYILTTDISGVTEYDSYQNVASALQQYINTGSIPSGTVSGSAQIVELGFATTSSVDALTGSIESLNAATSSYVTNSETGSFVIGVALVSPTEDQINVLFANGTSGSFTINNVQSASFATNALSASYAPMPDVSGFATTGSNVFKGSQTISGSLIVTGSITALSASITYLETVYQTSSVLFSSGSNILGDEAGDTQTLNGQVNIPLGNLNIATGSYLQTDGITNAGPGDNIQIAPQSDANVIVNLTNTTNKFIVKSISGGAIVDITGSLNVTDGITGSLQGTASYATNALSASEATHAVSASYAPDNSNRNGLITTGSISNTQSITGSLIISGSETITGPLYVNDVAATFQVVGNGFGQAYLQNPAGAIVLNPGYGGAEVVGANAHLKVNSYTEVGDYLKVGNGAGITGSVGISGSLNVTNGITGSLQGTASYATQALSASEASHTVSSSYANNATSASYSNNSTSASFAQTSISSSQADNAVSASEATHAVSSSYSNNSTSSSYSNNSTSSSYANNATSASFSQNTISGSFSNFAVSSSFATNALSSSHAINADTASYFNGLITSASYAVTSSIAFDLVVYGKCDNPGGLTKGTIVRITGANGDNPLFNSASWTNDPTSANTLGMLTADVAYNAFANVVTQGTVIGINTQGMTAGDLLFLSSSGQYTTSSVPAPYHEVRLGQVLRPQLNNGSAYISIDNGYELSELHDVDITSPVNGDLLVYRSGSYGQWVNETGGELGFATTSSVNQKLDTGSFNSYTSSNDGKVNALIAATGSYVTELESGSFLTTGSVSNNTLTFTKGNGSSFNLVVNTGSLPAGVVSGSQQIVDLGFATTSSLSSYVLVSQTSSMSVATASYVLQAVSSSYATNALTASFALNAVSTDTGSLMKTGSVAGNILTFTKGDGSTFNLTVATGSAGSTFPYTGSAIISGSLTVTGSMLISNGTNSGSVITNQTDDKTLPRVNNIVTLTSAEYNTMATASTLDANTLYVVSGSAAVSPFPYSGSIVVTGSIQGNVNALSISSNTASLNLDNGNFFTLQLVSGSATHINPSNIKPGQTINILLSTTGSGTVNFPSSVKQVSGSSYVPTTTTSKDIITLVSFDSSNLYLANVKNLI